MFGRTLATYAILLCILLGASPTMAMQPCSSTQDRQRALRVVIPGLYAGLVTWVGANHRRIFLQENNERGLITLNLVTNRRFQRQGINLPYDVVRLIAAFLQEIFVGAIGDGPGFLPNQFAYPSGVAIASNGTLIVADSFNNRLQWFSPNGTWMRIMGYGPGSGCGPHPGHSL